MIATSPAFGALGERLSGSAAGRNDSNGGRGVDGRGGSGSRATARGDADESVPDVSLGDAVSSAAGALADGEGGGGPSPLLIALLAISAALLATAVWRARHHRA